MKNILIIALLSLMVLSCKTETEQKVDKSEISETNLNMNQKIANANGLKAFDSISQINFTFNVKINDTLRANREWKWNTKTNEISLKEKDSTMTYTKDGSIAENEKSIDQKFVNDSYWLLFPYQLDWADADFKESEKVAAPISGKEMNMMSITYPSEGGYTPGDTYDIYFDDENMIQEWVYKPADGSREMATTWEEYEDFNGVKIAKSHKSKDGSFQLYFTDVSVKK